MRRTVLNDGWESRPTVSRFAELAGVGVAEWEPVTLPHDALIGTERTAEAGPATGSFPGGSWAYRRNVEGPTDEDPVVVLELEGAYRDAVVSVNGTIAGRRPYGYSGFFVRLDPFLEAGPDNEVEVEVRVHDDSRWYSGAGLHRNTWLHESGVVHFVPDGLAVLTPEVDEGGAVVTVAAEVRTLGSTTVTPVLRTELVDPDGTVVTQDETPVTAFPGEDVTARQRLFVADPRRWGPDHPDLYECRVRLLDGDEVLDEAATTFGIRSLSLDPKRGLRVNGEPVLLRGACVHHDNGPLGAATIDRAEERRVELLKAAGFNALRSAHNPMSRAMLDACDRLGILVMDETFDMWDEAKSTDDYSHHFGEWWEADTEAMVRKDVNHPSVVLYSIGNEVPDGSTATGLHRGRALVEKLRALDPSRYVTQAVSGFLVGGPAMLEEIREVATKGVVDEETGVNTALTNLADMMNEVMRSPVVDEKTVEAFAPLDVAGYNYMELRLPLDAEAHPHRVVVATETHPAAIDTGWAGVVGHPNVIGDFTWTGWDYLGEAGIGRIAYGDGSSELGMSAFHGEYPWLTAWCGDIDITGHRRPQSYYREIVFGLRTDPYVAVLRPEHHGKTVTHASPWAWSDVVSGWSWAGHEGSPVAVEVYADADEVELVVNGESAGRQPAGSDQRFRAVFETTYEQGEIVAVTWRGGEEVGRMSLRSASGPVRLDARADRTEIGADPSDLAFVELTLVDDEGNLQNIADRPVTVEVDGPGVLQGLASANPVTEEAFTGATCTTFDGRALAVVRPTGAGAITVRVTAEGCEAQELRIEAR